MVSKVEEAMKKKQQLSQPQEHKGQQYNHQQKQLIQCNKGKVCKFKRSSSNVEEDGVSSAILLLACIACNPSY